MGLMPTDKARAELFLAPFVTWHLVRPVALLLAEFALYGVCVFCAVVSTGLAAKFGFAFVAGILTATLGIIGHDCAHRGGTRHQWLNRLIATIGFLPALHPIGRWAHHHNQVHHRYTAQIGVDNAFSPMTVEAYRAATPLRRAYYRYQRSLAGHATYYLIDIWLLQIFLPSAQERATFRTRDYLDFAFVYAWLIALVGGLTFAAHALNGQSYGAAFANAAVFGLAIPFLLWNLYISFVTVIQHTGPAVRWSMPTGRPTTPEQKMRGTVHIVFWEAIDLLFHRLMQHTAHHLNPIIPMYSLKGAQGSLEKLRDDVLVVHWTPAYHWRLMRTCKLYDPAADGWCDFAFQPTV
ncbi:MAG TPA: fatty acid desaturase [Rhizomicrobium sp.]|jgi:omega-6 fatty acid desaturase (delta-12 desaturase)|nr:fatty acid desaturase [Rhizomicrobium sp.]